jgi:hypothetical protein
LLNYYNKDLYRFEFKSIAQGTMPSNSWSATASTTIWWSEGYVIKLPSEIRADPEELSDLPGDCESEDIPMKDPATGGTKIHEGAVSF